MREDYTHITVVLDSSGSMSSIYNATVEGFNGFLKAQKEAPGKATFTFVQFSSGIHKGKPMQVPSNKEDILFQRGAPWVVGSPFNPKHPPSMPTKPETSETVYYYAVINEFEDVIKIQELNNENFKPYGGTPLLDAIGWAINETGEKLASLKEEERPSKVLFVIITDGQENASRAFDYKEISEKIKHQTEVYSWDFMYLGANQDAIAEGSKMGISAGSSLSYGISSQAVGSTYGLVASKTAVYRSASALNKADVLSYSDEERTIAMNGGATGASNQGATGSTP